MFNSSNIWGCLAHFLSPSSKNKENPPRKNFFVFQEMKHSGSNIKKFLILSIKKAFLIFWETETPKQNFLIFQETGSKKLKKKILP